ncbi:hypothetical protein ABW09_24685 [Pluralibacter gergoviae]|nr:hypothetical protein ABW09_24685 [Pluralibacter gergoviae]
MKTITSLLLRGDLKKRCVTKDLFSGEEDHFKMVPLSWPLCGVKRDLTQKYLASCLYKSLPPIWIAC